MDASSLLVGREIGAVVDRLRRSTVRVVSGDAGLGSGVIWSRDGTVVTNAHVARHQRVSVELWDGRRFDARLVARDPRRDLAVLRIPPDLLAEARIGDARTLRTGELVIAVGNPLGLNGAASVGVVHAAGDGPLVRSDVRLAPGNSGGPLATADGHVVGVNAMVVGGLGVAIASHVVAALLAELAKRERAA